MRKGLQVKSLFSCSEPRLNIFGYALTAVEIASIWASENIGVTFNG